MNSNCNCYKLREQLLNSKQKNFPDKIKTNRNYYTKTTNMIDYPDYGPIKIPKLAYLQQSDPSLLNFKFMNNIQDSNAPQNTQAFDCNDEPCFMNENCTHDLPDDMEYIKNAYSNLYSNAFSTTYQVKYK